MKLDNRRREIQLLAGQHWEDAECIGSLEIATSIGKTWISTFCSRINESSVFILIGIGLDLLNVLFE